MWRLMQTRAAPGAWNMGVDEALLESVRRGGAPTLRFYEWSPACLSLGRNQPATEWHRHGVLRDLGVDVVRRITGGRAVLHDRELTYSAVLPDRALGSARAAYLLINQVLIEALRGLGVGAATGAEAVGSVILPSAQLPCFEGPAAGEVLVGERKLIGSAQVRIGGVLLQHGSIMLSRSPLLDRLDGSAREAVEGAPAYLDEVLTTPPSLETLIAGLAAAWERRIGAVSASALDDREKAEVARLASRYEEARWTWRL